MADRYVSFPMTLSDLWPGFRGHGIFEVEYLKNGAPKGQSYYSTLIGDHTEHIERYHVWWPRLTSKHVARLCQYQLNLLLLSSSSSLWVAKCVRVKLAAGCHASPSLNRPPRPHYPIYSIGIVWVSLKTKHFVTTNLRYNSAICDIRSRDLRWSCTVWNDYIQKMCRLEEHRWTLNLRRWQVMCFICQQRQQSRQLTELAMRSVDPGEPLVNNATITIALHYSCCSCCASQHPSTSSLLLLHAHSLSAAHIRRPTRNYRN